jgi:hypothetical protein
VVIIIANAHMKPTKNNNNILMRSVKREISVTFT